VSKSAVLSFRAGAGIKVAVGAATVEITSLKPGRVYRFTHSAGGDAATTMSPGCLCRFSASDAASSNGNFDFAVAAGESVLVRAPVGNAGTTLNVIEMDATSAATAALYIQELEEDSKP
jgi:hypothetical protein